jgi:hypothetical protein
MMGRDAMISAQSLREHLDRYAANELSISQLEEWLAAESWNVRVWESKGLQHLVERIHAEIIRWNDGEDIDISAFLSERHAQLHRAQAVTNHPHQPVNGLAAQLAPV